MNKILPLGLVLLLVLASVLWLNREAKRDQPASPPASAPQTGAPAAQAPAPASQPTVPKAAPATATPADPPAMVASDASAIPGEGPIFNLPNGVSIRAREGGFADLAATFLSTAKQGASKSFKLDEVNFSTGAMLSAGSAKQLGDLASILRAFPEAKIKVEASEAGDATLSAQRAEAVKIVLLERGVAMDRVATGSAAAGQAVSVVVTK